MAKRSSKKAPSEEDLLGDSPGLGHNGGPDSVDPNAREALKSFIARIERLEEEKADLTSDIKDLYAEVKGNGFDIKAVRKIIARRKRDAAEVQEEEAILETYMSALGMI